MTTKADGVGEARLISQEVADVLMPLVEPERAILFVGVMHEGKLQCTLRTRDFPDAELDVALREMRQLSRNIISQHKRSAMQKVDAALEKPDNGA